MGVKGDYLNLKGIIILDTSTVGWFPVFAQFLYVYNYATAAVSRFDKFSFK